MTLLTENRTDHTLSDEANKLLDELEGMLNTLSSMCKAQTVNRNKRINDAIADNRLRFEANNFFITVDGKEHAIFSDRLIEKNLIYLEKLERSFIDIFSSKTIGLGLANRINDSIANNMIRHEEYNFFITVEGKEYAIYGEEA